LRKYELGRDDNWQIMSVEIENWSLKPFTRRRRKRLTVEIQNWSCGAGKGGFTNNLGLNWTFCGCIIYESCSI